MADPFYSKEAIGKRISERLKQPKVSPVIETLKEFARRRTGANSITQR